MRFQADFKAMKSEVHSNNRNMGGTTGGRTPKQTKKHFQGTVREEEIGML